MAHTASGTSSSRHAGIISGPLPISTWLVAAGTDEVGTAPVGRIINGIPIVLFRTSGGRAVALEDRCPHKNAPLSIGRVVGDTLQCRYHGWRFGADGGLVEVPCHSPEERLPRCVVPSFAVVEQDRWIWLNFAGGEPNGMPPRYDRWEDYRWFELRNVIDAPLDLILENGLDCSHTGFAHEGLFRSAPTQNATAVIEATPTGVRVTTTEGGTKGGRDVRRTLGRGREIQHVDEVILPHTLWVDYHLGSRIHVVTILVCTPVTAERTLMFTRMGVRAGRLTAVVGRYVEWLTRKVVRQDLEVLERQAACIHAFGGREFRHVVADQPTVWMQRALRRLGGDVAGAGERSRRIVYRL